MKSISEDLQRWKQLKIGRKETPGLGVGSKHDKEVVI